jgi:outer membrane protein assembly factor BamE (lipoprotein component of BamABCDE complex)
MRIFYRCTTVVLLSLVLNACAQYENKRGVFDNWQDSSQEAFVAGQTTRQEVLKLLGPPSQVIALGDETVLYYLYEYAEGTGLVLIVYNTIKLDTRYDRAIFFFDENDRLTDHASYFSAGDRE